MQAAVEERYKSLIYRKESVQNPIAFVLGGQPGAGKTGLQDIMKELCHKNLIIINADEFRELHPDFQMLQDKYGKDSVDYTDILECHVIEIPKLPEISDGTSLYDWVEFMNCEDREGFEMIAQRNDYINEAYKQLDIISQDAEKRLEYTARQKAIYDYNTIMAERFEDGLSQGIQQGITERNNELIEKWRKKGFTESQIKDLLS